MGVLGLLKLLRPAITDVHISKYSGYTAGVDISCWMHRGSYSCSKEVVEGIPTTKYITFCMKMLNLLIDNGITPLVVFDGQALPTKQRVNETRRESREDHIALARLATSSGDCSASNRHYQQAVSITSEMNKCLQQQLQQCNIKYIVAPYEADAQLSFLSMSGNIDMTITEDSDAIVYGCKCILYKLTPDGNGQEIVTNNIFKQLPPSNSFPRPVCELEFTSWSREQFVLFCCLTGCDYATKLKSIGIKTAYKLVSRYKSIKPLYEALKTSASFGEMTDSLFLELHQAWLTYLHQTIYNPITKKMQHLSPLPKHYCLDISNNTAVRYTDGENSFDFLGPLRNEGNFPELLAIGAVDPKTLELYTSPLINQSQHRGGDCTDLDMDRVSESVWGFQLVSNSDTECGKSCDQETYTHRRVELEPSNVAGIENKSRKRVHSGAKSSHSAVSRTSQEQTISTFTSSMVGSGLETLSRRQKRRCNIRMDELSDVSGGFFRSTGDSSEAQQHCQNSTVDSVIEPIPTNQFFDFSRDSYHHLFTSQGGSDHQWETHSEYSGIPGIDRHSEKGEGILGGILSTELGTNFSPHSQQRFQN